MIVNQINVVGTTILESEHDSPIRPHDDGPQTIEIAPQRVKSKRRLIHILDHSSSIEHRENEADTGDILGTDLARIVTLEQ